MSGVVRRLSSERTLCVGGADRRGGGRRLLVAPERVAVVPQELGAGVLVERGVEAEARHGRRRVHAAKLGRAQVLCQPGAPRVVAQRQVGRRARGPVEQLVLAAPCLAHQQHRATRLLGPHGGVRVARLRRRAKRAEDGPLVAAEGRVGGHVHAGVQAELVLPLAQQGRRRSDDKDGWRVRRIGLPVDAEDAPVLDVWVRQRPHLVPHFL